MNLSGQYRELGVPDLKRIGEIICENDRRIN